MQEVHGVRLPEQEQKRVEMLIKTGYYLNTGDFLRDAVRSKLEEFEIVFPRNIKATAVKKEVLKLVKTQPNLYADEIAARLNLDIETVIHAIDELIADKKGDCMILRNVHDGIEGERIVCVCRAVKRQRVVPGSHAHRALEIVVEGTPAKCFVLKPVRSLQ